MGMNVFGSMTQVFLLDESSQVGGVRRGAQQMAEKAGFNEEDAGRVALLATELASNVLKHAERGELHLRVMPGRASPGVELISIDRGSGFDLAGCLADGYSTRGTNGIGLGAVSRMAQVFDAYSDPRGSVVMARVYPGPSSKAEDIRIGVSQHSLGGDPACGDAWHIAFDETHMCALVVDGLGHGPDAERAALAGAKEFAAHPFLAPDELMASIHQSMVGTRGGAVAIAQFDARSDELHFAGVGNISASIEAGESSRGLASHPGIAGVQFRKAHKLKCAQVAGLLLVMHSDGLQSRWRLNEYPGLWRRHPSVIAAVLCRDYNRGRDDVTVLVVALESEHA
jgi:anti-sigma regulatory factor (Ser/Thr protein kinase)